MHNISADFRTTEIRADETDTLQNSNTTLSNMRLFAIARFSQTDFNITEKIEGRNNQRQTKSVPTPCHKDSWNIYQNAFLSGNSEPCMSRYKLNFTNGRMEFERLEDAKAYLEDCYTHADDRNYNNGITQEKIGVYTIRKGEVPETSDSCEISWVYNRTSP